MRRPPPDKDGHSALSEVDSSNATLNTLFGARQKSWMMGAATPVRPTPRTSISKPSATPQVTAAQRNTAAVLPSPAPSDELSPVLPSSPPSEHQRSISNHENRQPSLASILLPQSGEASFGAPGGSENTETQAQNSTSPRRSYNQARRPTNPALEEPQLQRGLTDNPPLPSSMLLPQDRHQHSPIAATFNGEESHRQPSHIQPGSPAAAHVQGVSSIPAFPSMLMPQGPQPLRQSQVRRDQPLSPAQPNAPSPIVPSSTASPIQTSSNSGSSLSNPYKRQRTQPAVMPSLQPRIFLIEQHIASSGGRENLNSGLERPRFQLLIDACRNEDSFYVALHQLFCVWDTMPSEISRIGGAFSDVNLLTLAFKILGQLIRDNEQLAITHKRWFSHFPSPLPDLLRTSSPYRAVVADVGVFLTKLATDWNTLSNDCNTRKFPPLVDELVDRMGLLSPILQGVVFTATRRNIEISDGEFATRMEELFRQDQKDHQALSARMNTARPPTLREVQERNYKLKGEYLALYGQFMQQRLGSSSRLQTPILSSNSHIQSRPQPPSQHQPLQQSNWNPNMPSPDTTNNWHLPVQQSQAIQRTSSSSPNPNMVNRRPPSVGSHQVFTNAPSPTLLQGLHVHSPVQSGFQMRNNSVQAQPHHNVAFHPGPTRQELFYQAPVSPPQPHRPQMTPQQYAVQQQQQALINQQQQQLAMQQQAQLQQQAQWQHQNNLQHQQQVLNQGIQSLNRATQRRDSNAPIDLQQQMHSRANSIGSGGRQTPSINNMAGPLPRPLGQPAGSRSIPSVPYDQGQVEIINYNQIAPIQRPLVPPLGYVAPSQPTNPDLSALHQAHLRSPRLVASGAKSTEMTQDDPEHRYYQAVKGFALYPTKISSSVPMSKFDFMVPAADYALIPSDIVHSNGQVATREFRNGTLQYRLRCVQMKRNEANCAASDWVVLDTVWPESASLDINKHQLEIRRKNHHGKDLPIDITRFIRAAGPDSSNRISLSILRGRTKMKEFQYFLAVEIVEILHHSEILDLCQQNHIPESFTLNKIKKSLAGPAPGDDDDFAMVISDLAIDLADPFTARIFEIPVRGNTCLHRECFDLKTFLLTRNSKVKRPEQPCMIDTWKCPLCSKDARPYSLQIDDFLASVRVSLEDQGLLDVKAIWIGPDGKWRPKIEECTGIADDESSDDEASSKQKAMAERSKKTIQVIELDDD